MKKITAVLICILMIALLALPGMAAAPDQVDGVNALSLAWNGYDAIPDYSGGYWIGDDGVLTVGLVDEAGKAEVLAIVGDAPVNFVMQTYSYNELMAVQNELTEYFEADVGLKTLGVYVMTNTVEAGIDMDHPGAASFVEEMGTRYGNKLVFCDTDGVVLETTGEAAPEEDGRIESTLSPFLGMKKSAVIIVMAIIGVALVAIGVVTIIVQSRADKKVPTYDFVTRNFAPEEGAEEAEDKPSQE